MKKHIYKLFSTSIFLCVFCLCISSTPVNAETYAVETKSTHITQEAQLLEKIQLVQTLRKTTQTELRYFGKQIASDPIGLAVYQTLRDNVDKLKTGTEAITVLYDPSKISDSNQISSGIFAGLSAFDRDYSEVFWTDIGKFDFSGGTGTINITVDNKYTNYFQDGYQTQEQVQQDIDLVNQAISTITNSLSGTDAEKLRKIHDNLVDKNEYNRSKPVSSMSQKAWEITSALHYGSTDKSNVDNPVCEGYARAFKVLCDAVNIPCILVSGTGQSNAGSENHMWNYVQLDGIWYAVDVTWDDPIVSNGVSMNVDTYFLKGANNFPNHKNDGVFITGGYEFSYPTLSMTDYVPKADDQKIAEVKQTVSNAVQGILATNHTTEADITNAVNVVLKNTGVTASISGFKKTNATSSAAGSITGTITLQSGSASDTVSVNLTIAQLNQTDANKIAEVKQTVSNAVQGILATNHTTEADITNAVNVVLKNTGVTASISGFKKTNATSSAAGSITGTITLQSGSASDTVLVNLTIAQLNQTDANKIAKAKQAVSNAIQKITATNQTTEADITSAVNGVLTDGITASISGFQKTNATSSTAGSITGTITLKNGTASDTVPFNLIIVKLNQTDSEKVASVKQAVINVLQGIPTTNQTTEAYITNELNRGVLRNTDVTASISGFKKTDATNIATGSITGTITLQSGTASDTVPFNLIIAKLIQVDSEKISAVKQSVINALRGASITNQTTATDLVNLLNNSVLKNTGITASISGFNKTDATNLAMGSIIGTITLQGQTASDTVPFNLTIAKLNQTDAEKVAGVKQSVANALQGASITNQTTATDLVNLLNNGVLRNTGVTAIISEFNKTDATYNTTGRITGTITLKSENVSDNVAFNLTLAVIKNVPGNIQIVATTNSMKNEAIATITEKNVTDAVYKASIDGKNVKELTLTLDVMTPSTVETIRTRLPVAVQHSLLSNAVHYTAIHTSSADIKLDWNTLRFIREEVNADVDVSMKKVDVQNMSTTLKNAVSNRPFYDFSITKTNSNESIHKFGTGKLWISIPYTPQRVDKNGKPNPSGELEKTSQIKGTYITSTGVVSFVEGSYYDATKKAVIIPANHLSIYGVGYKAATDKVVTDTEVTNKLVKKSVPTYFVTHTIKVGSTYRLQITQLKDATMTVTSSNPAIANVTNTGVIRGKKAGVTTITYTVEQGGNVFTYKLKLTVKQNVKKGYNLKVSALKDIPFSEYPVLHSYREVSSKKKIKFGLSSLPKGAKVIYKSSNSSIASVNGKGLITGKKAGIAIITATVKLDGETYYYRGYIHVSDGKTKVYTSRYLK